MLNTTVRTSDRFAYVLAPVLKQLSATFVRRTCTERKALKYLLVIR
jgi:hypothetical protein